MVAKTAFRLSLSIVAASALVVALLASSASAHEPRTIRVGRFDVTFWTDPLDPVAQEASWLYFKVVDVETGRQLSIFHIQATILSPRGEVDVRHAFGTDRMSYVFIEEGDYAVQAALDLEGLQRVLAVFVADVVPGGRAAPSPLTIVSEQLVIIASITPFIVFRWLHILAAFLWLGGAIFALLVLLPLSKRINSESSRDFLLATLRRITVLVALSAALLGITGLLRAEVHGITLWSLERAFATSYGFAILLKMLIFVAMVGIGAYSILFMVPKLASSGEGQEGPSYRSHSAGKGPTLKFALLLLTELALGLAAIFLGAAVVQLHFLY